MESRDINGEKNLIISNTGRMEVLIVNRDLKFKKAFGLEGVSRLTGAMEFIKAVVTDSTLTAGANFGLVYGVVELIQNILDGIIVKITVNIAMR